MLDADWLPTALRHRPKSLKQKWYFVKLMFLTCTLHFGSATVAIDERHKDIRCWQHRIPEFYQDFNLHCSPKNKYPFLNLRH